MRICIISMVTKKRWIQPIHYLREVRGILWFTRLTQPKEGSGEIPTTGSVLVEYHRVTMIHIV